MVSGIIALMALLVPVPSLSIIFHMVVIALRVWFRLILICGEIIRFCRFFCAHARVCIISLGELVVLWLLVPGARRRLTLRMPLMSIDLSCTIPIGIVIMRALIIVSFRVLQKDIDSKGDFVFSSEVQKTKNLSMKNTLPVHERLALDDLTIAESTWTVGWGKKSIIIFIIQSHCSCLSWTTPRVLQIWD